MTQYTEIFVEAAKLDAIENIDALILAQDTIRIALKTAGYENVDSMNQFERASAMLDMAQELAALTTTRKAEVWESVAWANGRGYNGKAYKERTA